MVVSGFLGALKKTCNEAVRGDMGDITGIEGQNGSNMTLCQGGDRSRQQFFATHRINDICIRSIRRTVS